MKIKRRILIIFVILLTVLTVSSFALSSGDIITYNGITTTFPGISTSDGSFEDPENSSNREIVRSGELESISTIISKYETSESVVGIDVSSHQGEIDWEQVANSGVKFAMIRCGYRGLTSGGLYQDSYFTSNIEGAINNGIYVGVYFYSTALTEEEAIEEAEMVIELVNGYDIKYGIAYDFENFEADNNRTDNLSIEQINKNGQAFLGYIESKGYNGILYGSASYLNDYWDTSSFSSYDTWVAHYYVSSPNYSESYQMWQYTDQGSVPGISTSVDVDVDYSFYFKYNNIDITDYMFDSEYYSDLYPDLKAAYGTDAIALKAHYETYGKGEGRSASPVFDPKYYLNNYSDLKAAYGTDYVRSL